MTSVLLATPQEGFQLVLLDARLQVSTLADRAFFSEGGYKGHRTNVSRGLGEVDYRQMINVWKKFTNF